MNRYKIFMLLFWVGPALAFGQPCIPTSDTIIGVFPTDTLQDIQWGIPTNQVVQVVTEKDSLDGLAL